MFDVVLDIWRVVEGGGFVGGGGWWGGLVTSLESTMFGDGLRVVWWVSVVGLAASVGGGGGGFVGETRPSPAIIGGGVGLVLVGLVGGYVSSVDVGGGRLEGVGGGDEVGGGLTRPDPTNIGGGEGLVLVG